MLMKAFASKEETLIVVWFDSVKKTLDLLGTEKAWRKVVCDVNC
jgi:hypothetical protein